MVVWNELLTKPNAGQYCWTNYAILREDLGESPGYMVCPAERKRAANFIVMGTTNDTGNAAFKDNITVSYFVGVTASGTNSQTIMGGDRNLVPALFPIPTSAIRPPRGKAMTLSSSPTPLSHGQ